MARPFEETSTITSKGQTTVPKSVRKALGLSEGDQIAFRVDESGVTLRRADEAEDDPAIAAFLNFLAKDIEANPGRLRTLAPEMVARIEQLTEGMRFDPAEPIEGDVDL
jgi:antitoxin PrlF